MKGNCNREGAKKARRARKSVFVFSRASRFLARFARFAVCSSVACAASPQLARVELKCPEGQLAVDGAPAGEVKGKARFSLRPGHHTFELRGADGSVEMREADLGPGDQVALDLGGASK